MTPQEKITTFKTLVGDATISDATATLYLTMAATEILNARYPFGIPTGAEVPSRYDMKQCRLAAMMYSKQKAGIEADMTSHHEQIGNTQFTDTYADFTASGKSPWSTYLQDIVPVAEVD